MKNVSSKSLENLKPFQPGMPSANPAGRPKGSRSKLNEEVLKYLYQDFNEFGQDTIKRVRERKPEMYLAAVVSLLPKQQQKIKSPFIDLTDEELQLLETFLAASRAKLVQQIEPTSDEAATVAKQAADIVEQRKRNGKITTYEQDQAARSNTNALPNKEKPE